MQASSPSALSASDSPELRTEEFQRLKTQLHRRLVDAIDLSKAGQLSEEAFRQQLSSLAAYVCSLDELPLTDPQRESMVGELMDEIYGFGPLEPLMRDPEISDVLVSGWDSVFVERNGLLEAADVRFADDAHLLEFIQRLVGRAGRRIDEMSPLVEAKLPDGSRLSAVIPPLALRGPTLSIRRFQKSGLSWDDLAATHMLAPDMAEFLRLAVEGRCNILFSGGTGAGKTTLLNVLSRFIPASQRVVTIEQTAELQLLQADVVALEARPASVEGRGEVSQRQLLRSSLRMRPDRIILGEARGGEVLDMLQAMNTGHAGSMTTVHAHDPRDALSRLELMMALSGTELPASVARDCIALALDLIVHVDRLATGERRVTRISELCGCAAGQYRLNDVFVFRMTGADEGVPEGVFYATGYVPRMLQRLEAAGFAVREDLFRPRELRQSRKDPS